MRLRRVFALPCRFHQTGWVKFGAKSNISQRGEHPTLATVDRKGTATWNPPSGSPATSVGTVD
jgi:hypothetical protein